VSSSGGAFGASWSAKIRVRVLAVVGCRSGPSRVTLVGVRRG